MLFWPIVLTPGLAKRPHSLKAFEAVSLPVWCCWSSGREVHQTGVRAKVKSSWGWKPRGDPVGMRVEGKIYPLLVLSYHS